MLCCLFAEKSGDVEILTELTRKHIQENASSAHDQTGYQERYNDLLSRYNVAAERIAELTEIIEKRMSQKTVLTAFVEAMELQSQVIGEFGEELWLVTVEKVTVFSDNRIVFAFINSTEIEA